MRIRIQQLKLIRIHEDPDPQHLKGESDLDLSSRTLKDERHGKDRVEEDFRDRIICRYLQLLVRHELNGPVRHAEETRSETLNNSIG